jgi:hypothetical protein
MIGRYHQPRQQRRSEERSLTGSRPSNAAQHPARHPAIDGYAAGLTRPVGRLFGLDEFEIPARGEAGTSPRVTIGERIGDNLFVRIEQGFGAEQLTEVSFE